MLFMHMLCDNIYLYFLYELRLLIRIVNREIECTFNVLKKPCVRCNTPDTVGLVAIFVFCDCDVLLGFSGDALQYSRQLNSDADLLRCFPNFEDGSKPLLPSPI